MATALDDAATNDVASRLETVQMFVKAIDFCGLIMFQYCCVAVWKSQNLSDTNNFYLTIWDTKRSVLIIMKSTHPTTVCKLPKKCEMLQT